MKEYNIKIGTAFLLVLAYFGIMLSYTFLDVTTTGYQVQLLSNISFVGMMLAIGCSLLFFLLLDKGLDPIFEGIFSQSEQDYQEMIQSLIKSPMTSLIQVCVLAPVMEEILMRGVVLGGLKNVYILTWCKRYQLFCAALIGAGGISYYRVMPTYHNPSGNKAYIMNMYVLLRERGYKKASLSVQKENYAYRLYLKVGFGIVDENAEEYIMVCDL